MNEKLQQRLQSLKSEFEAGQKMLAELEQKKANLSQTLLRISGAIQVLEEVLNEIPEESGSITNVSSSDSGAIAASNPAGSLAL